MCQHTFCEIKSSSLLPKFFVFQLFLKKIKNDWKTAGKFLVVGGRASARTETNGGRCWSSVQRAVMTVAIFYISGKNKRKEISWKNWSNKKGEMSDVKEYLAQKRSGSEPISGEWAEMAELYDKRLMKRCFFRNYKWLFRYYIKVAIELNR